MKLFKCAILILLVLFCFGGVAFAEEALIVYGQDFAFKVTEPSGWQGITNDANRNGVNVYFRLPGYNFNSSPALIYCRILSKKGLTVDQHLQADMNNFSKRFKKIAFEGFDIPDLKYTYAAKKYIINDDQVDYLCYIDPGENYQVYAIFVLTAPSDLAEKHRDAFVALARSFFWMGVLEVEHRQ